MVSANVVALREFYHTPFGEAARALVAKGIHGLWPQVAGDAVLAIGYGCPYIERYREGSAPLMVCMPAHQGASCWPPGGDNTVFLAHESELPLADNSVNRVLLLHSLESSEQLSWMMQEIWRVLTPEGRVLAVAPNRMGLWARSSRSPFGHGRPFSMAQLRELLTEHHFTLTCSTSALFMPPSKSGTLWQLAPVMEILGKLLCPMVGGVLMQEAEKQVYASIKQPVALRKAYRMPVAATASAPVLGKK